MPAFTNSWIPDQVRNDARPLTLALSHKGRGNSQRNLKAFNTTTNELTDIPNAASQGEI
jgi:hypothetical protein